jgi:tellurite resistance protein
MRTKTQVLQAAKREIIERGWCQGEEENPIGQVCMIGAFKLADDRCEPSAKFALATAIKRDFNADEHDAEEIITSYNDEITRRRYQVLAKFDKAIDLLKRGLK